VNFVFALMFFAATGCATPALVTSDVPAVEPAPSQPAGPPAPSVVRVPATPPSSPAEKTCAPRKEYACAGAIGFCPEWRCIDGQWVDVRPPKWGHEGPSTTPR